MINAGGAKRGKEDEDDREIDSILRDISTLFLVPSKIKGIKFCGRFGPIFFPVRGMLNRKEDVYQVDLGLNS